MPQLLQASMSATHASTAFRDAVGEELAHLHASSDDAGKARALAALALVISNVEDGWLVPSELLAMAPQLLDIMQNPSLLHSRKNALALLAGLITVDEATWKCLVAESDALVSALASSEEHTQQPATSGVFSRAQRNSVPLLVNLLEEQVQQAQRSALGWDAGLAVNLVTVMTAAAQGGQAGAHAVLHASGLQAVLSACLAASDQLQLQEAAADALCQLASYDSCRTAMLEQQMLSCMQGVVEVLADLLPSPNVETRVRCLLCLGMLLPSSPPAQLQLARQPCAVRALMANLQSADVDGDCKGLSRELLTLLSSSEASKQAVAASLRAAVAAV
ncbi:hypothetical protein QJQ45_020100 [Haematococcus lacustris]|nr:hypothetical protein QJQ45_020100 [Haematococcus lacustris]